MRSRKGSDAVESWSCLRTGPDNIGLIPMAESRNDTESTVKWKSSQRNKREKNECSRRDSPSPSQHIIFFINSCYSNPYEILSFSLNFS